MTQRVKTLLNVSDSPQAEVHLSSQAHSQKSEDIQSAIEEVEEEIEEGGDTQ